MTVSTETPPASGAEPERALFLIIALSGLALVLGSVRLDSQLWLDEIIALRGFRRPPMDILTRFGGESHHPLYALLAHTSRALFGEHPWSLRLPAMLAGAASVPALYLLARELSWRREGLLAAFLLATSYHHVWFSQNARGYTLLTFFTLTSTLLLLAWTRRPGATRAAGWGLSLALGAYTLLTMLFVALVHALIVVWCTLGGNLTGRHERGTRRTLLALATAAALFLLLFAPMLEQAVTYFFVERPFERLHPSRFGWAVGEAVRALSFGLGAWPVLAAGAVLGTCGACRLWRERRLALAAMTLPAVATLAGAMVVRGTMVPRYLFHFLPFALLLLAGGVTHAATRLGRRIGWTTARSNRLALLLVLAIGAAQIPALAHNYRLPKQDFEGALAWIDETARPGDAILLAGPTRIYRRDWQRPWPQLRTPADLAAVGSADRVWVLHTLPRLVANDNPPVWALLERHCRVVRSFPGTLRGGAVTICRLDLPDPGQPPAAPTDGC